tara:strand:+ start:59 stop:1099 length:1041 start_codon:yes stop_codon:yes gene_type:complete
MGIFNEFFKKEKPILTSLKFGFGSGGGGAAAAPVNTYVTRVLMVAGGGGGGGVGSGGDGGGGGGGEVKEGELTLATGAYVFRVGDGGNASMTGTTGVPRSGTPTFISSPIFTTITAEAGGGGGSGGDSGGGGDGGSGGAGGGDGNNGTDSDNQPRGASTAAPATDPNYYTITGYGNVGGHGGGDGGGGGGAGAAGTNATGPEPQGATPGGNGQPFPAFASPLVGPACPSPHRPAFNPVVGPTGLYGGGGAAGGEGQEPSLGGPGGGGGTGNAANPGKEFTGGGGAGYENSTAGGNGGCGVIILRVPTANAPNITVPGSVTDATPGNDYKYFFFPGESTTSYPVSVS